MHTIKLRISGLFKGVWNHWNIITTQDILLFLSLVYFKQTKKAQTQNDAFPSDTCQNGCYENNSLA